MTLRSGMHARWILATAIVCVIAGCSGSSRREVNPLTSVLDPSLNAGVRERAVQRLPEAVEAQEVDRPSARNALRDVAWLRRLPSSLRVAAFDALIELGDPESTTLAREVARGLLPTERSEPMIARLALACQEFGWDDVTGALVRSLAEPNVRIDDADRPEYEALGVLHPGVPVAVTVFDVFLRPTGPWGPSGVSPELVGLEGRVRRDAWELLGRLDASGEIRARLLTDLALSKDNPDPTLRAVKEGLADARIIPLNGEELAWLEAMRPPLDAPGARAQEAWWSGVREALRGLGPEQRRGMRLRHLEAVRWASVHAPELFTYDAEGLRRLVGTRLSAREPRRPSVALRVTREDRFEDWADELSWPTLLSILVVDEAITDDRVLGGIAGQAAEDREDRTTEYGGLVFALDADVGDNAPEVGRFRAGLYRPRPPTRVNDQTFVASRFMLEDSTRALAHYHLHAQLADNGRYAGPSQADMQYAARYGRFCLVFTTVSDADVNVDLYTPEGVVIDMGTLALPRTAS